MVAIISRSHSLRTTVMIAGLALLQASCSPQPIESPSPTPQSRAATPAPIDAALKIIILGDSLSAGLGLPESDAFPAVVESGLRERGHAVSVINAGVSGDTSAGGLARLDWVLSQRPDILVVELGGNDALRGQPITNIDRNLREIVRRGLAAGARVLLLGMDVPTNYGPEYSSDFAAMYERIADEEGVVLVPEFVREIGLDPELMQADGLHPTTEGHRRLAETLAPHLEALVSTEKSTQKIMD